MYFSEIKFARAYQLGAITLVLMVGFGIIAWFTNRQRVGPDATFEVWFNGENMTIVTIMVGFFSNIIFGFIDNFGLFFGSNFLDEWFLMLPKADDANVFAGYGNTQSDLLGTFMATFLGQVIVDLTKNESSPIWGDAVGIILGCLVGVAVPKMILGSSSETHGANRASVKLVFLGDMEKWEVEMLINDDLSILQQKSKVVFHKLDENGSGTLDFEEIHNYMEKSLGDE